MADLAGLIVALTSILVIAAAFRAFQWGMNKLFGNGEDF